MQTNSGTINPMDETPQNPSKPSKWRKLAPLAVIAAVLGLAWSMGWLEYFSLSSIIQHRETLGEFISQNTPLAIGIYILVYAGLVAISFPGASLLTVAAGFLFGGIIGGVATVIGATIGAVIIFEIARTSFGQSLQKSTGKFVNKMREGFREDGFLYLLTLRLTPVFPFWVINIVPALLNMKLVPYAVATFLGIIPGTFAYSYIGSGLDSVIMAQEAANPGCADAGTCSIDPSSLITTDVLIAMAGLGLISLLPIIVKKLRARKNRNNADA